MPGENLKNKMSGWATNAKADASKRKEKFRSFMKDTYSLEDTDHQHGGCMHWIIVVVSSLLGIGTVLLAGFSIYGAFISNNGYSKTLNKYIFPVIYIIFGFIGICATLKLQWVEKHLNVIWQHFGFGCWCIYVGFFVYYDYSITVSKEKWIKDAQKIFAAVYIFAGIAVAVLGIFETDTEEIGQYIKDWDQRSKKPYGYAEKKTLKGEAKGGMVDAHGYNVIVLDTPDMILERRKFDLTQKEEMAEKEKELNKIDDLKARQEAMRRLHEEEDAQARQEEDLLRNRYGSKMT